MSDSPFQAPAPSSRAGRAEVADPLPSFARIRRALFLAYLLLLLVIGVVVLKLSQDHRQQARQQAEHHTGMLARLLEEHLARTLGETERTLDGLTDHLSALGRLDAIDERSTHELLKRRLVELPQLASLGIIDAQGVQFAQAAQFPTARENFSAREDFQYLRNHAGRQTYIGTTVSNPAGVGKLTYFSRRLEDADSRFGGVVRGGISSEYFARFYEALDLPKDLQLILLRADGSPIFGHPAQSSERLPRTAAFRDGRPAAEKGILEDRLSPSGAPYLISYHWLPQGNLGIFVGLPLSSVYGASRLDTLRNVASGILIAAIFGALFHLVFHSLRREEARSAQRLASEQALRDSEAKQRALTENIPQRIFFKDLDLRYLAVNRAYASDKGLSVADIVGRSDLELNAPDLAEKYRRDDQRILRSGHAETYEESYRRNGELRIVETVKTPVRDETGRIIGICGIYQDITEPRRLTQRLRESEASLRAIFDNIHEGILVADAGNLRLLMANPAICHMLGYREEALLQRTAADLHPVEVQDRVAQSFRNINNGRYALEEDMPILRADGSRLHVDISPALFTLEGKACVLGVIRDVSAIRAAQEALRVSEARLREAQRIARIGNWEHHWVNGFLHWSDEIYRIFEIDPGQFDESYEAFLAAVHPEDREAVRCAVDRSIEQHATYDITHRLLFADGRIKHVHEHGQTEYGEDGTPLRTIGTVQDVTEQVLAEQEIRALNESLERRVAERTRALEQANRELESFSYSVSHDLRAPLRAINGFSRILQETEAETLSAESRELLGRVVHNTNRMGDLIDDILEYSRTSQKTLKPQEVDLDSLVPALWKELAVDHPAARLKLEPLGRVAADPATLRQIFDNLIGNALKYSARQEQPLVEISATRTADELIVRVRDNGAGFDMQYAGKLFGMFQRMHTEREFPGTGVGLAICKRILERHGGRIWAEATPGQGASFWFSLPI